MSDSPVSTPVSAPVSASKEEDPVSASKEEDPAVAIAQHHATVIKHLVDGNSNAAFQTLMTDHNGLPLDYAESRMLYG